MGYALHRNRLGRRLSAGLPEFETVLNQFFRPEGATTWHAPVSIWEAENMFHVEADAPGVTKEDVEITFDKGTLQISLGRKAPTSAATVRFREAFRCLIPWIRIRSRPSSRMVCYM